MFCYVCVFSMPVEHKATFAVAKGHVMYMMDIFAAQAMSSQSMRAIVQLKTAIL